MSSQAVDLAGHAANGPIQSRDSSSGPLLDLLSEPSELEKHVAQLYGRGFQRKQIAQALVEYLIPDKYLDNRPRRLQAARRKLLGWERSKHFRDLMYEHSVVALDLQVPQILRGVAGAARRGRVDAAKLALEVTGRHTSRENTQVTAVQVNIANGIPRPESH